MSEATPCGWLLSHRHSLKVGVSHAVN